MSPFENALSAGNVVNIESMENEANNVVYVDDAVVSAPIVSSIVVSTTTTTTNNNNTGSSDPIPSWFDITSAILSSISSYLHSPW